MTWSNGRQLDSTNVGGMNLSYSYNADGQRTSKTRSAYYTDEYVYYGTQLSTLIRNGVGYKHSLTFIYDDNGQALGFYYDTNLNDSNPGTKYYYVCNAQGDVLQLRSHTNAPVANYYYDSWGKLLGVTDANGNAITASNHVAMLNPIRYRGYFYDTETGFYYLNSRYYDPQIGRWISPEPNVDQGGFDSGAGFLGYNVYAYCANNPVMYRDDTGESITLCILIGTGIGLIVGGAFGAYRANKNGYSPSDGWKYWKYVVGYGVAGGAVGALIGWGAGVLIAKYGTATAAASITKGGGARFSSFNALKRSLGSPGRGKQWHHIVEQCQIGKSGFSKYWIQNSNNVINISASVHNKISAYYSSIQSFTNGMTFRNWLAGQSFKTQYEWGIKVLRMFGVKI